MLLLPLELLLHLQLREPMQMESNTDGIFQQTVGAHIQPWEVAQAISLLKQLVILVYQMTVGSIKRGCIIVKTLRVMLNPI